ncbi:hypothetical protein [Acidiphilium acidophilum]|uniref:hypothetical protein n=1 Tax=Acidiphilium acidophilum TaxID=76588 RepID=UPI002E8E6C57|nr:hypothetical protein [Acidiphilium acidophilum]
MSTSAYDLMTGLLAVHLAGFAAWSGFLAGVLLLGPGGLQLLRWSLIAMPISLASGWALAVVQYGGPEDWPWAVNAMQTAGLAMAVVLLVTWFGGVLLVRDSEASRDADAREQAMRRLNRLVAIDLLLAVMNLGFAVIGRYG